MVFPLVVEGCPIRVEELAKTIVVSFDTIFRSSTRIAHRSVSKTSRDGKLVPSGHVSGPRLRSPLIPGDPLASPSTRSSHPSDTNRNNPIVASIKGRASMGLLVKSF